MRRSLSKLLVVLGLAATSCVPPTEAPPLPQAAQAAHEALLGHGPVVLNQAAGNLPGSFQVGGDGSASYSIAINVPSGRAGIEPELSFSYSSRAGDGLLGVGWSLGGASSAITRCGRTLARDGEIRGVEFGAKDYFCLDGNRLVMVAGASYTGDGAEYRTERDSFAKILSTGADAAGPVSFKVWGKDGRILTYGATAESRLEAWRNTVLTSTGGTTPALARYGWLLTRVEDRAGNFMTLTYGNSKPSTVGAALESWVARIDYTGFGTTPGDRSVLFGYDSGRSDLLSSWLGGIQIATTRLLTSVTTMGPAVDGGAPVALRQYFLSYSNGVSSGRSRLRTLQLCDGGSSPICLAPTQLTYSDVGATPRFTTSTFPSVAW